MPQHKKSIVAVNSDGSMAGYFESMRDLCTIHHLTKHWIAVSCNTGKLYRGMRWMWNDEYERLWLEGRTAELAYERPEGQKPMQRGDKVSKSGVIADNTAYCYVLSLIRRFGDNVTLAQVKEQLNDIRNETIEENHQGIGAAWT